MTDEEKFSGATLAMWLGESAMLVALGISWNLCTNSSGSGYGAVFISIGLLAFAYLMAELDTRSAQVGRFLAAIASLSRLLLYFLFL